MRTDCHVPLVEALARHDGEAAERIAKELALGWIDQIVIEKEA